MVLSNIINVPVGITFEQETLKDLTFSLLRSETFKLGTKNQIDTIIMTFSLKSW